MHPVEPPARATGDVDARAYPAARRWRNALAPYEQADTGRAVLDVLTSVVPYLALCALMYLTLDGSYLVVLALSVPAAGFLVRAYIVFHDCAHGSFLPSRRANAWLGAVVGLLVFAPFRSWRHGHAVHHATSGDLERRGVGDVHTLTVAEYRALPRGGRLLYRLYRSPLVMFGLAPVYLLLQPRLLPRGTRPHIRRSILGTNLAVVAAIGALGILVGWREMLLVQVPSTVLAGATGAFLFYVQHQFETAYWATAPHWSFADAALRGSSYLKLPRALQFFTGNIGFHHVHHLDARIPNYNLQRAHEENAFLHDVPTLTLAEAVRTPRLKLWDEHQGRLVTFAEARGAGRSPGVRGGGALGGPAGEPGRS